MVQNMTPNIPVHLEHTTKTPRGDHPLIVWTVLVVNTAMVQETLHQMVTVLVGGTALVVPRAPMTPHMVANVNQAIIVLRVSLVI